MKTTSARLVLDRGRQSLISSSGALLLRESVRVEGLDRVLSAAWEPWPPPRSFHDPGKVLIDVLIDLATAVDPSPIHCRCSSISVDRHPSAMGRDGDVPNPGIHGYSLPRPVVPAWVRLRLLHRSVVLSHYHWSA
ncbi:hypothetical protein R3Q06_34380 [Rhodococcus erythropolis]|uniref:hypothetical protein n=1 Tax=Rhodococcus erythropolis TaxID=1833 RepID=UPI0029494AF9|nr:hypothetical protein [Rhodococcus erythropolis]MDV6278495.1 hypothetical protein [Rhodococcus erythropolis]